MNISRRPNPLGAGISDLLNPSALFSPLLTPRPGQIIETPGQAAALSLGAVAALGGALLLVVMLKSKKII